MKKAVVFNLGCKVNDVESGSIIRGLEELGYEVGREIEEADLFVINTCAVTREAERKSRQTVSKALAAGKNGKVIVCGCASEKSAKDFFDKDERVVAVLGAQRKNAVLEIVKSGFAKELLGINIPSITLPVKPGRNLAVVIEVAAINHRQKRMGYNAAEALNERLINEMEKNKQ